MNQPRRDTLSITDDERIEEISPLIKPKHLIAKYPLHQETAMNIKKARKTVADIVHMRDPRLLVVSGPCSIHNVEEALEYAHHLRDVQKKQKNVFLVMRTYFEKPRTTTGWKGLINDPHLDDSCDIEEGLHVARKLLLDINQLGLPTAVEWLDVFTPQYIADLVTWGAIGARTTESQEHRKLVSGLSMPVGFKNGTDGNIQIALDAIQSAQASHVFMATTKQGEPAKARTSGNEDGHIILRGSNVGPNYATEHVQVITEKSTAKNISTGIVIDVSHGNSEKNHRNQPKVSADISSQLANGNKRIVGVMIEGNLHEGKQNLPKSPQAGDNIRASLKPGVSITDGCVNWETNREMIEELDRATQKRNILSMKLNQG